MKNIQVGKNLFEQVEGTAADLRATYKTHGIFSLNLMSGPGAGKTTLLTKTLQALSGKLRVAVLEGDIQTSIDADRLAPYASVVRQINTDGACHLDPRLVEKEIESLDLANIDALIVENVGNLVCPAEFDLGEGKRAMLLSVTEGHDKPSKYPLMFRTTNLLLINKIDLLPYTDFDIDEAERVCRELNPEMEILRISCRSGEGLESWYAWLQGCITESKKG